MYYPPFPLCGNGIDVNYIELIVWQDPVGQKHEVKAPELGSTALRNLRELRFALDFDVC